MLLLCFCILCKQNPQPRQGQEKLRELEELMEQAGLKVLCGFVYSSIRSLPPPHMHICLSINNTKLAGFLDETFDLGAGDAFEISDDETGIQDHKPPAGKKPRAKAAPGGGALPVTLEGDNKDVPEALSKYKKAVLNKRTILKAVKDRLDAEKSTTHVILALQLIVC